MQRRHDAVVQRGGGAVVDAQAGADPAQHQRGVAQRREVDVHHAVGERVANASRDLDGDTGLADAARSGQRQQLRVATLEQLRDSRGNAGAPQQRGQGAGQSSMRRRACVVRGWRVIVTRGREQRGAVPGRQHEGVGEQRHRRQPRPAGRVAFEIADRLGAQARPLCERFLGHARRESQVLEHRPERGLIPTRAGVHRREV